MRLILIRHGEVAYGPGDGPGSDVPLTPTGALSATRLGERLEAAGRTDRAPVCLVSPQLRALQTAERVQRAAAYPDFLPEPALTEIGSIEGESLDEGLVRVDDTLERLAQRYADETVIAVSHAGFIMGTLLTLLRIPVHNRRARLEPDFLSMTEWSSTDGNWVLRYYNVRV